jgi:hypothetical protein
VSVSGQIAVQFGVAKSTVENNGKNREAMLKAWEENENYEKQTIQLSTS